MMNGRILRIAAGGCAALLLTAGLAAGAWRLAAPEKPSLVAPVVVRAPVSVHARVAPPAADPVVFGALSPVTFGPPAVFGALPGRFDASRPAGEAQADETAPAQASAYAPVAGAVPLPPPRPAEGVMVSVNIPLPPVRPPELAALTPGPQVSPLVPPPASDPGILIPKPAGGTFARGSHAFVRIFKQEGELELWLRRDGKYALYKTYPICKWSGTLGPKLKEGDYQSPEGFYSVSARQLNPNSAYHLAFNVGFPNAYDRQNGRTGSALMVHGDCVSVGCFAMTNKGIEDIYGWLEAALKAGQGEVPVHIFPFRMSESAIARETGTGRIASLFNMAPKSSWGPFWRNLKEGYDLFEQTGEPPAAYACNKRYAFGAAGARCQRIAGW